jgi:hypothetical protein
LFVGLQPAAAVSVELAKKCQLAMRTQFPPREPGNPAAGSEKGTPQDVQKFYQDCLKSGGPQPQPKN